MKRKVIRQGQNTLTVSLPSGWAKKNGIKQGLEVDVSEQGRHLVLSSDNPGRPRVAIDISGITKPIVIWRYLLSAYRAGYDEILVTGIEPSNKELYTPFTFNTLAYIKPGEFSTMSPIETISACVNRLIGVEIIEHKEGTCLIKDLNETSYKEFDSALRRIFLLLKREAESIIHGLEGRKEELKSIHIIDTNIDRFEDFCLRVLNKKGYHDFKKTPTIYNTIFLLEMVGDEFKKIATHIIGMKGRHSANIKKLFRAQYEQLERFYSTFYSFSKGRVKEIYEENERYQKLMSDTYHSLDENQKGLAGHFKNIGSHILSLTELAIDLNV